MGPSEPTVRAVGRRRAAVGPSRESPVPEPTPLAGPSRTGSAHAGSLLCGQTFLSALCCFYFRVTDLSLQSLGEQREQEGENGTYRPPLGSSTEPGGLSRLRGWQRLHGKFKVEAVPSAHGPDGSSRAQPHSAGRRAFLCCSSCRRLSCLGWHPLSPACL